jgi:hypothetical protein
MARRPDAAEAGHRLLTHGSREQRRHQRRAQGQPVERGCADVVEHAAAADEVDLLEHQRDVERAARRAVDGDGAGVHRHQAGCGAQPRGLARAVGPEHGE